MERFRQKNFTELLTAIAFSILFIFAVDVYVPRGVDVWVFYLIPLILCSFCWKPALPIIVTAILTMMMVTGFFLDTSGVAAWIEWLDRLFGILTFWTIGIIIHFFIRNKLIVREQEWVHAAQSGVAEQMRGERSLPVLGDKVLRFLCEYLNAQVGVIYSAAEDGVLRKFAAYAWSPITDLGKQSIGYGEGLAGQAAKSKQAIHVRDLPADHIQISSATGDSKPRHLVVAPALAEGEVEGVMELGFMREVDPLDLRLLNLLAEPVGMAIRASKYRGRLEALLAETQHQAAELETRSQELRLANQELEEHSRILRESQVRLEAQQAELEETNAQLEEQTDLLENQKEELTNAQSALAQHAAELARASAYKSEFLANMSHELRTPLNSLLILAKLLMENKGGNLTAEQLAFSRTIYSAGNDLLTLINDVLDLSAIEAGKVTVQPEPIPIRSLLDGLSSAFRPLAQEKKLTFRIELDPKVPFSIVSDSQRVTQILKNLLSNAIKFTHEGAVVLRVSAAPKDTVTMFLVNSTGNGFSLQGSSRSLRRCCG